MLDNKEVWKTIKGYDNYQGSTYGRVWNVKRQRYCVPSKKPNGYMSVNLYDNYGKRKKELVHRLVALTYIPNPEHKPQVNHIDLVRDNNRVDNLEWVTIKENVEKSTLPKKISVYDLYGNELYKFNSIREACLKLNLTESNVIECLSGRNRQKTHKGYKFKRL